MILDKKRTTKALIRPKDRFSHDEAHLIGYLFKQGEFSYNILNPFVHDGYGADPDDMLHS